MPPISKTIETRTDTRTYNLWGNIGDSRPFSDESTSYQWSNNKRKSNQSQKKIYYLIEICFYSSNQFK
jgi:hypothetical protein